MNINDIIKNSGISAEEIKDFLKNLEESKENFEEAAENLEKSKENFEEAAENLANSITSDKLKILGEKIQKVIKARKVEFLKTKISEINQLIREICTSGGVISTGYDKDHEYYATNYFDIPDPSYETPNGNTQVHFYSDDNFYDDQNRD